MMLDDKLIESEERIPTNLRILLIIEKIAATGTSLSAPQLSEYLGLPKASVYRLLSTAEEEGFLQRDISGQSFLAGKRLENLAQNTMSSVNARVERLAIMTKLSTSIGETCNLSIPSPDGMIYLERVETKWPLQIRLPIGSRVPYHCTASGKMVLSQMDEKKLEGILATLKLEKHAKNTITDLNVLRDNLATCRRRAYSTDNEEFLVRMVAVAVPIFDNEERLLATLSVHAPKDRFSISELEAHLPQIVDAARKIQELTR